MAIIDLQERKEAHLLSWSEVLSTPPNPVRWTVHCKGVAPVVSLPAMLTPSPVGGEVMGVGFGVQKAVARQAAAKQACEVSYANSYSSIVIQSSLGIIQEL
jgi:hypothetical protein